jgi:hypothetical protein
MVVFVAWVDDIMILETQLLIEEVQHDLEMTFMCKWEGEITKYVSSKLTFNCDQNGLGTVKITQLVLVQKLVEEDKPSSGPVSNTPAVASQVLMKSDGEGTVADALAKMYWSATATCMYIMQ